VKLGGRDLIWVTTLPLREQTEERTKHPVTTVDSPAEIQTWAPPECKSDAWQTEQNSPVTFFVEEKRK